MSDTREPDSEPVAEKHTPHEVNSAGILEGEVEAATPEDARPRSRLLPMWILIAAVIVVGVAWALSDRYFGELETTEIDVPLVTAEETPFKVRPEEPGGVEVPDRDKYVYKSLTEEEPDAEQLLPPPEEPMQLPAAAVVKGTDAQIEAAGGVAETVEVFEQTPEAGNSGSLDALPPDEVAFEDPKALVSEPEDILPKTLSKEAEPVAEVKASAAAGETVSALSEKVDEPEPELASVPEPEFAAKSELGPVSELDNTAALTADTPGFLVQIGATQKEDRAASEIARVAKKYPEILASLGSVVVRTDLGEKGVWYRMRIGPFANRAEADATCGKLKAVNVGCFVVAD